MIASDKLRGQQNIKNEKQIKFSTKLFFDWKLMQLPIWLVDYVILHESIHLIEPHHGAAFWERLERALPDWRERKEELRTTAKNFVQFLD